MEEPGSELTPPCVVCAEVPKAVAVHVVPPGPRDEWRLDHPYVLDRHPGDAVLRAVLTNFDRIANAAREGTTTRQLATLCRLTPEQLVAGITRAANAHYLDAALHGDQLTITATGATPSVIGPVHDPITNRYDPRRLWLRLRDITDRPPSYDMFQLPPLPHEHWALDSRYSRGTWGHYLGPNANRLLGLLAAELREPDAEFATRPAARALRITPRRLHAELDQLANHGLLCLDHDHGAIATSGYVKAPSAELLRANPIVAAAHRCLIRQRHSPDRSRTLDL